VKTENRGELSEPNLAGVAIIRLSGFTNFRALPTITGFPAGQTYIRFEKIPIRQTGPEGNLSLRGAFSAATMSESFGLRGRLSVSAWSASTEVRRRERFCAHRSALNKVVKGQGHAPFPGRIPA